MFKGDLHSFSRTQATEAGKVLGRDVCVLCWRDISATLCLPWV